MRFQSFLRSWWPGTILLVGIARLAAPAVNAAEPDACVQCHAILQEDLPSEESIVHLESQSVHSQRGLGCADCHGGDPTAVDDPDQAMYDAGNFVGAPAKQQVPEFCGRCHSDPDFMKHYNPSVETDQVSQYYTSRHGKLLQTGEKRVASCTDCHTAHGIQPVSSPRSPVYPLNVPATCAHCHSDTTTMAGFGIPTDQYLEYSSSVHGVALLERRDIGAPACNDCHGNHGAIPPGVDDIANICGNCHANNQELFQKSHLRDVFIQAKIPLCIGCHGKHAIINPSDAQLDWNRDSICGHCHEQGHDAQHMATVFYDIIDSLKTRLQLADSLVNRAEQKGMMVTDLLDPLENAHKALIQTRTSIHSFNEEIVEFSAEEGQKAVRASITGARRLLQEVTYRRRGLFVASLITTLLVVSIYLRLRYHERGRKSSGRKG
jgi:hypothetical protein